MSAGLVVVIGAAAIAAGERPVRDESLVSTRSPHAGDWLRGARRRRAFGICNRRRLRQAVHERARAAARRRPHERLLPLRARPHWSTGPCLRHSYVAQDAIGRATAALTGVFLLVLALVLCARDPLTFLAAWELMTLVPAAIILIGATTGRPKLGVRLHRAHARHGRRTVDRGIAAGRCGRVRRRERDRDGIEHTDRDRRIGARRHGDEGRARPTAHVAAQHTRSHRRTCPR